MFKLFLCTFMLLSSMLTAGGENSIWNGIDPMDLGVEFEGKAVKLKVLTDPSDLPDSSWEALKKTFVATYLAAWKDKTPDELGIQGSKEDFLNQQFDNGLTALKDTAEACFLSFEQVGEEDKPFLGIFSQLTGFEFEPPLPGKTNDTFFLRLMVFTTPAVFKSLPQIGKPMVEKISPIVADKNCTDIVTGSRPVNVAQNAMLEAIGFTSMAKSKISGVFEEDVELLKLYPQSTYIFFDMKVKQ